MKDNSNKCCLYLFKKQETAFNRNTITHCMSLLIVQNNDCWQKCIDPDGLNISLKNLSVPFAEKPVRP